MTAATDLLARIVGLHPSDRQWLLSQASAEMRQRLTAALEGTQPDNNGTAVVPHAFSARDLVASATAENVARALQTQPAWLATVLLQMEEWPWTAAFLKRVTGRPMGQPGRPIGQPAQVLKPALAAAILQSFARSLTSIEASSSATPSPRLAPFEALVQRFRTGAPR
jgi:hypothetical protein